MNGCCFIDTIVQPSNKQVWLFQKKVIFFSKIKILDRNVCWWSAILMNKRIFHYNYQRKKKTHLIIRHKTIYILDTNTKYKHLPNKLPLGCFSHSEWGWKTKHLINTYEENSFNTEGGGVGPGGCVLNNCTGYKTNIRNENRFLTSLQCYFVRDPTTWCICHVSKRKIRTNIAKECCCFFLNKKQYKLEGKKEWNCYTLQRATSKYSGVAKLNDNPIWLFKAFFLQK